jgi:hypothetical protein
MLQVYLGDGQCREVAHGLSRFSTLPVALLLVAISCSGKPIMHAELIGAWVITGESRADLGKAYEHAAGRITFKDDGTFAAVEMPGDFVGRTSERPVAPVTGSGTWTLSTKERGTNVELVFQTLRGGHESRVPYGTFVLVERGSGDRVVLFYFQGDPDENRRIEFEKR